MGFAEQNHRHRCDERDLDQEDRLIALENREATYAMAGLVFGFVVVLTVLGVGVYSLTIGHVKVASACLGAGLLAGAARVFVNGRMQKPSPDQADDSAGRKKTAVGPSAAAQATKPKQKRHR